MIGKMWYWQMRTLDHFDVVLESTMMAHKVSGTIREPMAFKSCIVTQVTGILNILRLSMTETGLIGGLCTCVQVVRTLAELKSVTIWDLFGPGRRSKDDTALNVLTIKCTGPSTTLDT